MHIYLVGPQSHGQTVYACLTGPFISQLWNVLLRSHDKSCCLFGHVWILSWLFELLLVCRASSRLRDRTSFGRYDRGIRLAMAVTPSVTQPLTF